MSSGTAEPMTASERRQFLAKVRVGYGAIHLVRRGDKAVVEVEYGGEWYPVISEALDGNFSNCVHPAGILYALEEAGVKVK